MVLGPTPGEGYLAYIGLPDDYPHGGQLLRELDDEIITAAELVIADWKKQDPLLRVMLHEDCELWSWVPMPAGDVLLGTRICMKTNDVLGRSGRTFFGRVRRATAHEAKFWFEGKDEIHVNWEYDGERPPPVGRRTQVKAYLPVPFDLSALLAEIDGRPHTVPPLTGRPPKSGQWSTLDFALRCYGGKVYRHRGRGGYDPRPSLRKRGWIDGTDMVTALGRRVVAAYSYNAETGELAAVR